MKYITGDEATEYISKFEDELKDCVKELEFGSWIDKDTKGKIE